MVEKKDIWFKRKLYGWGWTPSSWQGWVIIFIYVISLVGIFLNIDENSLLTKDIFYKVFIPFILITFILIIICYKKGQAPRWQWGNG